MRNEYAVAYFKVHDMNKVYTVAQLVEALRYKPEGRVFDSRLGHWETLWCNPSGDIMTLESTRPLTDVSTARISRDGGSKGGRCLGLTSLPPRHSGSFNLLEPQGPVQACNGVAFWYEQGACQIQVAKVILFIQFALWLGWKEECTDRQIHKKTTSFLFDRASSIR